MLMTPRVKYVSLVIKMKGSDLSSSVLVFNGDGCLSGWVIGSRWKQLCCITQQAWPPPIDGRNQLLEAELVCCRLELSSAELCWLLIITTCCMENETKEENVSSKGHGGSDSQAGGLVKSFFQTSSWQCLAVSCWNNGRFCALSKGKDYYNQSKNFVQIAFKS